MIEDVHAAAARLAGVAVRTPAVRVERGDAGPDVWLKLESLQRTGAFKFRGACNLVASLPEAERARGLVTASSGNHAQGVALAAALHEVPATIFMPRDAPEVKRRGTERWGATVVEYSRSADDREALVEAFAARTGAVVVPPYDDDRIIAGAGTACLELLSQVDGLDAVVVPTSGGGSLAGWSVVCSALAPSVRVLGVCPSASDAPRRSLAAGRRERVVPGASVADGLLVPTPGERNFALYAGVAEAIASVPDELVLETLRWLALDAHVVVEPSGAVALAAVRHGLLPGLGEGMRVGVLVSGGNVDGAALAGWLAE